MQQLDVTIRGSSSSTLADRKEQMLCEDHAVMEVVGQFGFDGCHSLKAALGRQPRQLWAEHGRHSYCCITITIT